MEREEVVGWEEERKGGDGGSSGVGGGKKGRMRDERVGRRKKGRG